MPQIDPRLMFDLLQECTHLDVPKIRAIWGGGQAAMKTLEMMGYSYLEGAELWKPPLGKKPDFDLFDNQRARFHAVCAWLLHDGEHASHCNAHANRLIDGCDNSCDCGFNKVMEIVFKEVQT